MQFQSQAKVGTVNLLILSKHFRLVSAVSVEQCSVSTRFDPGSVSSLSVEQCSVSPVLIEQCSVSAVLVEQ